MQQLTDWKTLSSFTIVDWIAVIFVAHCNANWKNNVLANDTCILCCITSHGCAKHESLLGKGIELIIKTGLANRFYVLEQHTLTVQQVEGENKIHFNNFISVSTAVKE